MQATIYSIKSPSKFVRIEMVYHSGYEPRREVKVYACDRHGKIVSLPDQDPYDDDGLLSDLSVPNDEKEEFEAFVAQIRKWGEPE